MNIYFYPLVKGISCHMANCSCMVVKKNFDNTLTISKKTKKPIIVKIPFIRGIIYLLTNIILFFNEAILLEKNIGKSNNDISFLQKMSKGLNISYKLLLFLFIFILGFLLSTILFGYLPILIASNIITKNLFFQKLLIAVLKIIILISILFLLKLNCAYAQMLRFNGAINNFMYNYNCNKMRNNGYYPINFLLYLVFGFIINFFVLSLCGITANSFLKILSNFSITLTIFSVCYEIMIFCSKSNYKFFFNLLKPLNYLITMKATTVENVIVQTAFNEVLLMSENVNREIGYFESSSNKLGLSYVLSEVKDALKKSGIYDESEAEWLVAEVLKKNRAEIKLITFVSKEEYKKIKEVLLRRIKREPLSKILGEKNFYGLDFNINENVLSPRMETELLVELVIKNCHKGSKVLDVGTGSGIIAICLAKMSEAKVTAVDISESALKVAMSNAKKLGAKVNFVMSDLFNDLKKNSKFDIIVSNPPYIKSGDIETLDKEVKDYDPLIALDGGNDGLYFYRKIIADSCEYLTKNGKLFFELGKGQAGQVKRIMQKYFTNIKVVKDYNGINRIIYGEKKE